MLKGRAKKTVAMLMTGIMRNPEDVPDWQKKMSIIRRRKMLFQIRYSIGQFVLP